MLGFGEENGQSTRERLLSYLSSSLLFVVFIASASCAEGRSTQCVPTSTISHVTMRGGIAAGDYTKVGSVISPRACAHICCQNSDCDVAFMANSMCYNLQCYSAKLCQTRPALESRFLVTVTYVKRGIGNAGRTILDMMAPKGSDKSKVTNGGKAKTVLTSKGDALTRENNTRVTNTSIPKQMDSTKTGNVLLHKNRTLVNSTDGNRTSEGIKKATGNVSLHVDNSKNFSYANKVNSSSGNKIVLIGLNNGNESKYLLEAKSTVNKTVLIGPNNGNESKYLMEAKSTVNKTVLIGPNNGNESKHLMEAKSTVNKTVLIGPNNGNESKHLMEAKSTVNKTVLIGSNHGNVSTNLTVIKAFQKTANRTNSVDSVQKVTSKNVTTFVENDKNNDAAGNSSDRKYTLSDAMNVPVKKINTSISSHGAASSMNEAAKNASKKKELSESELLEKSFEALGNTSRFMNANTSSSHMERTKEDFSNTSKPHGNVVHKGKSFLSNEKGTEFDLSIPTSSVIPGKAGNVVRAKNFSTIAERINSSSEISMSVNNPLAGHKKSNCRASGILYNKTLVAGLKSGDFTDYGKVKNMGTCVTFCCLDEECDMSLMLGLTCYTLHCSDLNLCKVRPAHPSSLNPRITFVVRDRALRVKSKTGNVPAKFGTRLQVTTSSPSISKRVKGSRCKHGAIQHDVTLSEGQKAGIFRLRPKATDMDSCLQLCCKDSKCNVAFLIGHSCYSVQCHSKEDCNVVKARSIGVRSQLVLVRSKIAPVNDKRQQIPQVEVKLTTVLNITNQVFSKPLGDFESLEFLNLAERIQIALSMVLGTYKDYKESEVISFRPSPLMTKLQLTVWKGASIKNILTTLVDTVKAGKMISSIDGSVMTFLLSGAGFKFLKPNGFNLVCDPEQDFDVDWTLTVFNELNSRPCPRKAQGQARRGCHGGEDRNATWGNPSFVNCITAEYKTLQAKAKGFADGAKVKTPFKTLHSKLGITPSEILIKIQKLTFVDTYRELLDRAHNRSNVTNSTAARDQTIHNGKSHKGVVLQHKPSINTTTVHPTDKILNIPLPETSLPSKQGTTNIGKLPQKLQNKSQGARTFSRTRIPKPNVKIPKQRVIPKKQTITRKPVVSKPLAQKPPPIKPLLPKTRMFNARVLSPGTGSKVTTGANVPNRNIPAQNYRLDNRNMPGRENPPRQPLHRVSSPRYSNSHGYNRPGISPANVPDARAPYITQHGYLNAQQPQPTQSQSPYAGTYRQQWQNPNGQTLQNNQASWQSNQGMQGNQAWQGSQGQQMSYGGIPGYGAAGFISHYRPSISSANQQFDIGRRRKRDTESMGTRNKRQGGNTVWYNGYKNDVQGTSRSELYDPNHNNGNFQDPFLTNVQTSYNNDQQAPKERYPGSYNIHYARPTPDYQSATYPLDMAPSLAPTRETYGERQTASSTFKTPTNKAPSQPGTFGSLGSPSPSTPGTASQSFGTQMNSGLKGLEKINSLGRPRGNPFAVTAKPPTVNKGLENTNSLSTPQGIPPVTTAKPMVITKHVPLKIPTKKPQQPVKSEDNVMKNGVKPSLKPPTPISTTAPKASTPKNNGNLMDTLTKTLSAMSNNVVSNASKGNQTTLVGHLLRDTVQETHRAPMFGGDLTLTADILRYLADYNKYTQPPETRGTLKQFLQVGSHILDKRNKYEWRHVAKESHTAVSALDVVRTIEDYSTSVSEKLHPNDMKTPLLTTNIMVSLHSINLMEADPNKDISFPNYSDPAIANWTGSTNTLIVSPRALIAAVQGGPGQHVRLISSHVRKLSELLPNALVTKTRGNHSALSGNVFSINTRPSLGNVIDPPIKIILTHVNENLGRFEQKCVFWKTDSTSKSGTWSSKGCSTVGSNLTHTTCTCSHMTTFAVIADTSKVKRTLPVTPQPSATVAPADEGSSILYILLALLAILIIVFIILAAVFFLWRKRRQQRDKSGSSVGGGSGEARSGRKGEKGYGRSGRDDDTLSSTGSEEFDEMIAARRRNVHPDERRKTSSGSPRWQRMRKNGENSEDLLLKEKSLLLADYHQPYHFLSSKSPQDSRDKERSTEERRARNGRDQGEGAGH